MINHGETMRAIPDHALAKMVARIAKREWVVVNKAGTTVLQDPGLGLPFHTRNKKYAEQVAKEVRGAAILYEEALRLLSDKAKVRA